MRAFVPLIILVFVAPAAGAFVLPAPAGLVPALPDDITDAEVLRLLAPLWSVTPTRLAIPTPPPGLDVPTMVLTLGARAGMTLTHEDVAVFQTLDPQVAAPVLTMLVAIDHAWTMRDAAFATWTTDELLATRESAEGVPGPEPRVLTPDEKEMLLNAAIMLSDTIESFVIPQLQAAADAGVWPPIAIADPVGVLRIGSSGNDVETIDRILQIDAQGDDEYYNNAGGTSFLLDFDPTTSDYPVAASLDLSGEDDYVTDVQAQSGSNAGIGILFDLAGNDLYRCGQLCQGGALTAVSLFRDAGGSDEYLYLGNSQGYANNGFGYARDDGGDDLRLASVASGGYGLNDGVALLWDQAGTDLYNAFLGSRGLWGFARDGGRGWFVDETASIDSWTTTPSGWHTPACNGCTWSAGAEGGRGRGNDNHGGLSHLIAAQDP